MREERYWKNSKLTGNVALRVVSAVPIVLIYTNRAPLLSSARASNSLQKLRKKVVLLLRLRLGFRPAGLFRGPSKYLAAICQLYGAGVGEIRAVLCQRTLNSDYVAFL